MFHQVSPWLVCAYLKKLATMNGADNRPLGGCNEVPTVPDQSRRDMRTPITLKIKFKSSNLDQFIERYSVDVSRGGIFIRTKEPLQVGTNLKFEFQLQDTSSLIAGEGTVVWIREHDPNRTGVAPGMGVRFDRLQPSSMQVLERIRRGPCRTTWPRRSRAAAVPKSGSGPSRKTSRPAARRLPRSRRSRRGRHRIRTSRRPGAPKSAKRHRRRQRSRSRIARSTC